jgi:hypothetical protein
MTLGKKKPQSDLANPVLSDCNHKHRVPIATSVFRAQVAACVWAARDRGCEEWGVWSRGSPSVDEGGWCRRARIKKERRKEARGRPTRFYSWDEDSDADPSSCQDG